MLQNKNKLWGRIFISTYENPKLIHHWNENSKLGQEFRCKARTSFLVAHSSANLLRRSLVQFWEVGNRLHGNSLVKKFNSWKILACKMIQCGSLMCIKIRLWIWHNPDGYLFCDGRNILDHLVCNGTEYLRYSFSVCLYITLVQ